MTVNIKVDDKVYKDFKDLEIITDDGIRLTLVSQKLQFLVNLFNKVYKNK